jgi:hypothetical protein
MNMNSRFSRSSFAARGTQFSHHFRAATALSLLLAIFLTSLCLHVSAQTPTEQPPEVERDYFILDQGANGDTVCREANLLERRELQKIAPKNLRQINHTGENAMAATTATDNAGTNLTIILRATPNLEANAPAKAAFLRAAAAWEAVVNSPITIYLDADFGPDNFGQAWSSGTLGATSSPSQTFSYSAVRNQLIAGANSSAKTTTYQLLPTNSLPVETNSGNVTSTSVSVSHSVARAIGLLPATAQATDTAARIGFNSAVNFDFDHSNGVSSVLIDFEAVATHEIGHALGFTSRSGAGTNIPAMWDLYRFRSTITDATFTNTPRVMTIGGTTANSQYYFTPGAAQLGLSDGGPSGSTDNNADGNQSSHWRQQSKNGGVLIGIMDPRIPNGTRRDVMPNDINALSIFGYNSAAVAEPTPPPNDNFSAAQTIAGCSGTVSGTNVAATREANEPNHEPTGQGGQHSVWYNWQAPATGSVTFTTAGSGFDTVLAAYTGNAVGSLTSITKNDDVNPSVDTTSSITFNATAGTVYRIAVDGFNNAGTLNGEVGPITLNWNESNCGASVWVPTVLNANQVELKSWTISGRTSIYVKLTFPDAGYRVANWGTPVQSGNTFTVDASVERWTGGSAAVITNTAQIYDLGNIPAGNYTFNFRNSGTSVKTLNFTVSLAAPPANPIDDPHEFVRWQYKDFLRREPDGPGWDHWTAEITMCGDPANRFANETEAQCVERKRANTSAAFFLSPEHQNTGSFVLRVYKGSLGRMPHFGGTGTANDEFTNDAALVAQGIVVNNALSPAVINSNKQAFVNIFVARPEFRAIYDGLNSTQYVDRLFQTTGVTPTAAERQALIDGLGNGSETRASVLFKVVDGTLTVTDGALVFQTNYGKAFYDATFNAAFVQMEYFGYLQRDPDDAGYAFWLGKLNQFGNWVDAQMVLAFINSPEYRSRFGAP